MAGAEWAVKVQITNGQIYYLWFDNKEAAQNVHDSIRVFGLGIAEVKFFQYGFQELEGGE